jgi:hypothetical protein
VIGDTAIELDPEQFTAQWEAAPTTWNAALAAIRSAAAVPYPRRENFKPAYREPIQKFTH